MSSDQVDDDIPATLRAIAENCNQKLILQAKGYWSWKVST